MDLFSLAPYSLQTAGSLQKNSVDMRTGAHANVRRDFATAIPFVLRAGIDARRQDRDIRNTSPTWTFLGPDGVANTADDLAARYDVVDTTFSAANAPFSFPPIQRPSPYKLWQLYQEHPDYFRFERTSAIQSETAGSLKLVETVAAGYVRGDMRACLPTGFGWLVASVMNAPATTDSARSTTCAPPISRTRMGISSSTPPAGRSG